MKSSTLLFAASVLVLAGLPFWWPDPYVLSVVGSAGIFIIAAISLNLLLGYTGQLSLGHVAFFGIGAYTSALLSLGFDVALPGLDAPLVVAPKPVWVAFVAGIVVAGLFGWLVGKLAFRVRGAYFVIVTISFAQVMRMVATNWVDLTEGPMALNNIPPLTLWTPAGVVELVTKAQTYWLVLAVAVLAWLVVAGLVHSRTGRAMVALRENETLARSIGVPVTHYLRIAAVGAAAIAGAAGGLYAHTVRIIDPDVFMFMFTITMVIMVIVGGKGTLAGPVVGGLLFGLLPELLRGTLKPEVQWMLYGALMVVILVFMPRGIVPALSALFRKRPEAKPAAPRAAVAGEAA
ncbi:branched-chain amino acid ABC transporter permease [Pseudorhodoferax sp. Leaf265]|jgi:branched-chain amino acid transport system permease protein|uniref:branched-chain amino acid ABC transporter permease n=1 Tax=Pseudorhodoferax sp. Leaf265 TaxID=1736315 RepID=UPI0006FC1576|nr:branched-chain amino acid ABC transporter permease [Pseudorhodoferax sp. Leaf265]KQP15971.1 ABC transporter permease [Pseudorhodoferax sp. Leaf265]PZQ01426.1 MAG: branched-chain amino acid ABC transporter permease [Variovorax paradoxus]PZQ14505.1 MAG: branched-chain amino acid ABC transporter permease [Variovorax paradoxus]